VKKKVGEDAARHWIRGMRSLASNLPISPFHLAAADDMESLLNEVLLYRKKKEWVGLTDEEIVNLLRENKVFDYSIDQGNTPDYLVIGYVRLLEEKIREKNGD